MIGLDTTAIIDLFKGDEGIKKFLEKNKDPLASTMFNYLELQFGLDHENKKHIEESKYYEELFESIYNINLTKEACKRASQINWKLKKSGKEIEQFDCIIAALFLERGIKKIVTRNKDHFNRIEDIEVMSY